VNQLDVVVSVAAAAAVLGGWRLGFLARVFSWLGLGVGLYLGSRVVPTAVAAMDDPDQTTRLVLAVVVILGGAFVGQAIGLMAGMRIHRVLPMGPIRLVDRSVGGVLGAVGVVASFWFFVMPWFQDIPGWPSEQARSSELARVIDRFAPERPDHLQALRRLVGGNAFPQVFEGATRSPETGPPPRETGFAAGVQERVSASTVKVVGEACKRIQEGSGFAAENDLVVTNAHVVAGMRDPSVVRNDGRRLAAKLVLFDSDRDLALLRVRGLKQSPLPVANAKAGDRGAVFGHPNGQDELRVAPANISQQVTARGRDLYDAHRTDRDVFILAATLRPGDSGGALTNLAGQVIGVAFAIAPDAPGTSYALTTKELRIALSAPRQEQSSGSCLRQA